MTPTERAKRSDALYYETVSVTRRVLCDMIANREADLEDAKAEGEHMRLKALAVAGELQEENERLKADNAKLREQIDAAHMSRLLTENENAKLRELISVMAYCNQFSRDCDGCSMNGASGIITERAGCDELLARLREMGVEVSE